MQYSSDVYFTPEKRSIFCYKHVEIVVCIFYFLKKKCLRKEKAATPQHRQRTICAKLGLEQSRRPSNLTRAFAICTANSGDSGRNGRLSRLIIVFVGCTCHFECFIVSLLNKDAVFPRFTLVFNCACFTFEEN